MPQTFFSDGQQDTKASTGIGANHLYSMLTVFIKSWVYPTLHDKMGFLLDDFARLDSEYVILSYSVQWIKCMKFPIYDIFNFQWVYWDRTPR